MADQSVSSLSFSVESTNFQDNKIWEFTNSLDKQGLSAGFQALTSDYAAMTFDEVATTDYGELVLVNLSNSQSVIWGTTVNGEFTLKPTEFAKLRLTPGTTELAAKTLTGSAVLYKYLLAE